MKSLWSDADAAAAIKRWSRAGVDEALALRTYSARLLGADPDLVLHGGGNTSVKTTARDLFGEEVAVLCVKGSGWDLATIEPAGHPAVRLAPLRRLLAMDALSDEGMVNFQRLNMLDAGGPNPSVETLLHAFLPHRFIDHTHATAVLALANQPDAEHVLGEVYGDRVALVPYVMPGFALAKAAAQAFEARLDVEGLVLVRHGLISFGATARESYERMIALVTAAERFLDRSRMSFDAVARPSRTELAQIAPRLRGALARAAGGAWPMHWILDIRSGEVARALADDPRLSDRAGRGVATPDHVIRTKRQPLVLPRLSDDADGWRAAADAAVAAFVGDYRAYFERQSVRFPEGRTALDPLPRVAVIPGVGLVGLGQSLAAAAIAADIAEVWAGALLAAESVGRFAPLGEADTFDMEYWSLEQAKLGKGAPRSLAGHIVLITGAAGAIGAATARAFLAEGAHVALIDVCGEALRDLAQALGPRALAHRCDVTVAADVEAAFADVSARLGGVDIVVSNAGTAVSGAMAGLDDAALRASFDVNLFAHQSVARAAISVFRAQAMGGALLFNASKQAINPGPDFGAYGAAKAALLALMRQYALEHGAEGVRVNAVNPDRIRSGLLTAEMISVRAHARGVQEAEYMTGNLLRREVTADDVGQAFVFAARMPATTGAILPVDGGNAAAMLR